MKQKIVDLILGVDFFTILVLNLIVSGLSLIISLTNIFILSILYHFNLFFLIFFLKKLPAIHQVSNCIL
jgi:hypothetical protein